MAAPAFRAAGTLAHGTTDQTPAAPAGLATDDIELLLCESQAGTHALTTANGFVSAAADIDVASGTATIATHGSLWWRRYSGQADPVVTVATNHILAQRYAFSGCATSGDPWDFIEPSSEATEDTTGDATGNTTTSADCLIAVCLGSAKPDSVGTAEISAPTNANLTSVTERADNAGNSGNGGHVGLITGVLATPGATGNTTYTKVSAGYKFHYVVALKPPSAVTANPLAVRVAGQAVKRASTW